MWNNLRSLNNFSVVLNIISFCMIIFFGSIFVLTSKNFNLKRIVINGEVNHISKKEIEKILSKLQERNFFLINFKELRDYFLELEWVSDVNFKRKWPNIITVELFEHTPFLNWENKMLISKSGVLFKGKPRFTLPLMKGPKEKYDILYTKYSEFSAQLKDEDLNITSITVDERNSWKVRLNKNLIIKLGNEQIDKRFERFALIFGLINPKINLNKHYIFDMRYFDGFALQKN